MIAYLQGILADVGEEGIVLEVNHVGYNIKVPASLLDMLPGLGEEVKIHTYTCVREDSVSLFGFLEKADLDTFKQLITVNGVGPKAGLSILSALGAETFRLAVLSQDAKTIAKAPGIGAKTAQRIILDLKDKISLEDTLVAREAADYASGIADAAGIRKEAVEALVALGYSSAESLRAVKQVPDAEQKTVEQILKEALKYLF